MIKFILKRLFYGILVMFGVTTVVFFLFNVLPGDPARILLGNHAEQSQIDEINRDLGRDKPIATQYLMYLNDLSPVSVHDVVDPDHYLFLNKKKYTGVVLFNISSTKAIVLKYPYLRRSWFTKRKVSEIIMDKLPKTAILAVASIVLASILGIIFGIFAAVYKNSVFDRSSPVFAVLGMAGPSFFVGIIVAMMLGYFWSKEFPFPVLLLAIWGVLTLVFAMRESLKRRRDYDEAVPKTMGGLERSKIRYSQKYFFGVILPSAWKALTWASLVWFIIYALHRFFGLPFPLIDSYLSLPGTGLNNQGSIFEYDDFGNEKLVLKNLVLPSLTLGIRPLAIVLQLTRSSLLEVLSHDYIRTARAKGLSFIVIVLKHALKNALNPVITAISGWFAGLMAGAVFVEEIFNWKGLGSEVVAALFKMDLPVLMGCVLVSGLIFVVINIFVDIVYGFLDPRVRLQ